MLEVLMRLKIANWIPIVCFAMAICPLLANGQDSTTESTKRDKAEVELDLKSFDFVWKTIKEQHWDKKLVGDLRTSTYDRVS